MAAYPFFPRFTPSCAVALFIQTGIPTDGPFFADNDDGLTNSPEAVLPPVLPRYMGISRYTDRETGLQAYRLDTAPDTFMIDVYHGGIDTQRKKLEQDSKAPGHVEWVGYLDLLEEKLFTGSARARQLGETQPEPVEEEAPEKKAPAAVKKGGRVKR